MAPRKTKAPKRKSNTAPSPPPTKKPSNQTSKEALPSTSLPTNSSKSAPSASTPHVAAQISSPHYSQLMTAFSEMQSRLSSYWAYVAERDAAQRSKANKTIPTFPSEILEPWSTPTDDAAPTSSDESEE